MFPPPFVFTVNTAKVMLMQFHVTRKNEYTDPAKVTFHRYLAHFFYRLFHVLKAHRFNHWRSYQNRIHFYPPIPISPRKRIVINNKFLCKSLYGYFTTLILNSIISPDSSMILTVLFPGVHPPEPCSERKRGYNLTTNPLNLPIWP